uniref:Uncharacterized protein n=1 Tax=Oryza nivara TaxID=4536 RepID=A0A0E0FKG9_ORYNI
MQLAATDRYPLNARIESPLGRPEGRYPLHARSPRPVFRPRVRQQTPRRNYFLRTPEKLKV